MPPILPLKGGAEAQLVNLTFRKEHPESRRLEVQLSDGALLTAWWRSKPQLRLYGRMENVLHNFERVHKSDRRNTVN